MKRQWKDRRGVTMVEVIVAFGVLMVCMAMVMTCVLLAGNAQRHAAQRREDIARMETQVYGGAPDSQSGQEDTLSFSAAGAGAGLSFTLPAEVTAAVYGEDTLITVDPIE